MVKFVCVGQKPVETYQSLQGDKNSRKNIVVSGPRQH